MQCKPLQREQPYQEFDAIRVLWVSPDLTNPSKQAIWMVVDLGDFRIRILFSIDDLLSASVNVHVPLRLPLPLPSALAN